MISTKATEARLTSARNAICRYMVGPHLGYQKYAIALTGDYAADELLGAVYFRCIDQRHPERKSRSQRFFLVSLRMSSFSETRRALAQCRDDCAVAKLYRPTCASRSCP